MLRTQPGRSANNSNALVGCDTYAAGPVASPCIQQCCLAPDNVCTGCGRTRSEIAAWSSSDCETQRSIVELATNRRQSRLRSGFTLVELLVVISIIGILVGLLLPAVQAAREAVRRIQCANNLKQMGLGFHNYHSVYNKFPVGGAGVASATNAAIRRQWRPSWGSTLLPFMEQTALYNELNLDVPYLDSVNQPGGAKLVPIYLCPTAPKNDLTRPNGDTPTATIKYGRTDYGGNYGERALRCAPLTNCQNNYADTGGSSSTARGVLLFGQEAQLGVRDILDGTSQTIIVGEAPEGLHSIWIGHKNLFDQSAPISAPTGSGSPWASCAVALKSREGNFCDFGQEFHSYHAGGANFLMVDGSASFVSAQLDVKVFAALLSRIGGEIVGEF